MLKRRFLAAIALVLLLGAAVGAEVWRDAAYGEPAPEAAVLYVRSGEFLKRASISNASLLADLYWIRAVQYFGGAHRSKDPHKSYDLLYPLLDITTTLDPDFGIGYRFGAIFLAEPYPGGPGRPDLAIKLLEKGIRNNPSQWRNRESLAFTYYWYQHDYKKAAEEFERAASVPGAPWWMHSMAAVMYNAGGDRRTSRLLWQHLSQAQDNKWLRENALWRLAQLDALDQIDRLEQIVTAWTRRNGAPPASWETLARAGWLRGVPVDPSGSPYVLDSATGRVTVSRDSKLFPLPTEP